jgi:hypothetical protein
MKKLQTILSRRVAEDAEEDGKTGTEFFDTDFHGKRP